MRLGSVCAADLGGRHYGIGRLSFSAYLAQGHFAAFSCFISLPLRNALRHALQTESFGSAPTNLMPCPAGRLCFDQTMNFLSVKVHSACLTVTGYYSVYTITKYGFELTDVSTGSHHSVGNHRQTRQAKRSPTAKTSAPVPIMIGHSAKNPA